MQYITAIYISRVDIYQRMDAVEGEGRDITAAVAPPKLRRSANQTSRTRFRDIRFVLRAAEVRGLAILFIAQFQFYTGAYTGSTSDSFLSPTILSQRRNITKEASCRLISTDCVARSQR